MGVILLFSGCPQGQNRQQKIYMNSYCTHVDSIWCFLKKRQNVTEFAELAVNQVNRLKADPNMKDSAQKLLSVLEAHIKLNPDPILLSYYTAMKCRLAKKDGHNGNVVFWHQKWQSYEPFASTNNIISHSLDMGSYYYNKNVLDSALVNMNKALNISETKGDTFYRNIILINLGAVFFQANMFKSASDCFSKALVRLEPLIHNNIPIEKLNEIIMLNNNLMVSFIEESKYSEVYQIYNKYNHLLKRPDLDEKVKNLFELNYINALLRAKNYSQSESTFSSIKPINPEDANYSYYMRVKTNRWLNLKKYDSFTNAYKIFLPYLYRNQPISVKEHFHNIQSGIKLGLIKLNYDSLIQHYIKIPTNLYMLNTKSVYCTLFSQIEELKQNNIASLEWKNKALEYTLEFNKKTDNIKLSHVQDDIKRARILKKLSDQENQIEKSELRQNWLTASSSIFGVLLMVVTLLLFSINKSRKKQINILALEAQLKEREVELLKIKNEKQANTVLTSNMAIQKISELSEFIRQSDLAKNPTMIDIRMNIDRLTEVVYKEYNDENQQDIYENYAYLRDKHYRLKDLNTTSFRVLVLSILGNTPKDIANLLNLNMQYVRNIRSKIKKDLQADLGENWDWQDLQHQA